MSVTPTRDRRAERHEATRAEILECRLGARPGARAWPACRCVTWAARSGCGPSRCTRTSTPSTRSTTLCSGEGYERLLDAPERSTRPTTRVPTSAGGRRTSSAFCVEDPARYQLLFQRTIPGFEPSAESYDLALQTLEHPAAAVSARGRRRPSRPRSLDCARHRPRRPADLERSRRRPVVAALRRAVDMFFDHLDQGEGGHEHDHDRVRARSRRSRGARRWTWRRRSTTASSLSFGSSTPTSGRQPTECPGWDVTRHDPARAGRGWRARLDPRDVAPDAGGEAASHGPHGRRA